MLNFLIFRTVTSANYLQLYLKLLDFYHIKLGMFKKFFKYKIFQFFGYSCHIFKFLFLKIF